jgi:hypothetical protein
MKASAAACAAAAVLALAAGCGSAAGQHAAAAPSRTPATSPAASPSTAPGPARFLAEVRAAGFGDLDLTSASDQTLLSIGSDSCSALDAAKSGGIAGYSKLITSLAKNHAHPTVQQATVWVDSAIRNLCPENSDLMPSGAP